MGNYFAIDAIEPSMKKTTAFFSGPSLFRKWAKLAVLIMVFMLLSGGGGSNFNFSLPDSSAKEQATTEQATQQIKDFVSWFSGIDFGMVLLIAVVVLIVLFIIGTILNVVKYTAMFSILNGITTNDVRILGHAGKYLPRSISLALFDLLLGLIALPFTILMVAAFFGIFILFFSAIPELSEFLNLIPFRDVIANPAFIIITFLISLPVLLFFSLLHYIKGQFGVYLMYTRNINSALDGFRKGISIVMQNKLQTVVLLLVQLALTIVLGIISFIIALIVAIPFAIAVAAITIALVLLGSSSGASVAAIIIGILVLLPLAIIALYAASFALSPIHVFCFHYNLQVLENFMGAGAGKQKSS